MTIFIITTGGTLDSYYDVHKCTTIPYDKSKVSDYLSSYDHDFRYFQVCAKSSEDITTADLEAIARRIDINHNIDKFVIIHGTVTLQKSAIRLAKLLKRTDAKVVLVGSYYPYHFANSDGPFNLATAITSTLYGKSDISFVIKGKQYATDSTVKIH